MSKKNRVIKLTVEPDFNFTLIAISTSLNDYNLSWALNENLNISLKRDEDIELISGEEKTFSLYRCCKGEQALSYSLVCNKSDSGILVKEMSNIDFFLKIEGSFFEGEADQIIDSIKNTKNIILAYRLTPALLPVNHRKKIFSLFASF